MLVPLWLTSLSKVLCSAPSKLSPDQTTMSGLSTSMARKAQSMAARWCMGSRPPFCWRINPTCKSGIVSMVPLLPVRRAGSGGGITMPGLSGPSRAHRGLGVSLMLDCTLRTEAIWFDSSRMGVRQRLWAKLLTSYFPSGSRRA